MANLTSAGMKSLGELLGKEGARSNRVHEAFVLTDPLKLGPLSATAEASTASYTSPEVTSVLNLNIQESIPSTGTHLIDIVEDFESPIPIDDVATLQVDPKTLEQVFVR